jgi:hypothetical protein
MADATVRVSGPVLALDVRSGISRPRNPGEPGNPYSITTARVLVEESGVADVRLPDALAKYGRGEVVDLLCDATVYGGRVQLSATRDLLAA